MKLTLVRYLYSIRNSIVHAKANYVPTGFECEFEELQTLNEILRTLCYTIVCWSSRY